MNVRLKTAWRKRAKMRPVHRRQEDDSPEKLDDEESDTLSDTRSTCSCSCSDWTS